MNYIKSPFNYIGNKYRVIDSLEKSFPATKGKRMLDLFCGGCDVVVNTEAGVKMANDINVYLIGILKKFQELSADELLGEIDRRILAWGLSKTNKENYLKYRNHYNHVSRDPLDLYTLLCFSFNYQFRFNSKHEYNNPFGANRSSFNDAIRANLAAFKSRIDTVELTSLDFLDYDYSVLGPGDFVYADPPYLLGCGSYNDGKRGFRGWGADDDEALYLTLDSLADRGVLFGLSNVLEHKGEANKSLLDWARRRGYRIVPVDFSYSNCNYHKKDRRSATKEVLVTNY